MSSTMTLHAHRLLRILQALSQARIRLTCAELSAPTRARGGPFQPELNQRIAQHERLAMRLLAALTAAERSEVILARALFLQLLLESAPQRLRGWSDQDPLDRMPPSRLFEWISHDHEQLELAQLEALMTPEETARYLSASSAG